MNIPSPSLSYSFLSLSLPDSIFSLYSPSCLLTFGIKANLPRPKGTLLRTSHCWFLIQTVTILLPGLMPRIDDVQQQLQQTIDDLQEQLNTQTKQIRGQLTAQREAQERSNAQLREAQERSTAQLRELIIGLSVQVMQLSNRPQENMLPGGNNLSRISS